MSSIIGGYDGSGKFYKSTEFVYPDGRVVAGIDLPQRRRSHCMAKLDSTRALIISGYVYEDGKIGGDKSVSTLIYNSEKNSIESGPDLKSARASAACGVFTSSLFQGAHLVMVAGGVGGGNAVETWDYTGSFGAGWQKGKKDLTIFMGNYKKQCDHKIPLPIKLRGLSQTTLTSLWLFLTTNSPFVDSFCLIKVDMFGLPTHLM